MDFYKIVVRVYVLCSVVLIVDFLDIDLQKKKRIL